MPKSGSQAKNTSSKNALSVSATTVIPASDASSKAFASPCLHCEGQHTLQACRKFRKILHNDQVSLLMKNRLCFDCFGTGHRRAECGKKAVCNVCKGSHATALHRDPIVSRSSASAPLTSVSSVSAPAATTVTIAAIGSDLKGSCDTMSIIPVKIKLRNSDNELATYAFLDTGSSDTIITEQLMAQLNARGQRTNVNITTLHGCDVLTSCVAVPGLEVCGYGEENYISLPTVYTQPSLPVTKDQIPTQEDVSRWPYLSDIVIHALDLDIGILIGGNAWNTMEPWKIVNSIGDGPYAVYTLLGWVVNGPVRDVSQCNKVTINRLQLIEGNLDHHMQWFFDLDFSERQVFSDKKALSVEDKRFLDMVEQATVLHDGHYEVCLPLRDPFSCLPNNCPLAVQRLKSLKKKFSDTSYQ